LIDDVAMRHRTWNECHDRINGVSRAKFRKVQSDDEERKVLQEWDVQPEDLVELEFVVTPPRG
jgi:viroplasmin and RNaseH domain-containing protein